MKILYLLMAGAVACGTACSIDDTSHEVAANAGDGAGNAGNGAENPGGGGAGGPPVDPQTAEALRCGPPPHQPMWLSARDIMGPPAARDLAEVYLTFKHCPESRFVTGADGRVLVMVSRTANTWVRFEKQGYLPWMIGEVAVTDGLPLAPLTATMVPEQVGAVVVPAYKATDPLIYVQVQLGRADAPEACRSREGVVFSVKGHPEAQVSYRAAGSNAGYVRSSATTIEGVAIISGLAATAGPVEIVAVKPGCNYLVAYGDVNSPSLLPIVRTPLAAGAITHQVINPVR